MLDSFPSSCSDLTIIIINTIAAVSYCTLKWFQLQTNKIHKFIGRSCVQVTDTKRCFLIIEWYRRMDRSCQVKHYKIEHCCTVVCWLDSRAVGRKPVFRQVPRHLYETYKTKGLLFGEQRNTVTMAIHTCMFKCPMKYFHDKLCLSYMDDAKSQQSCDSRQVFWNKWVNRLLIN